MPSWSMPMHSPPPGFGIRVAHPGEVEGLREIEVASEQLFAEVGMGPFSDDEESSAERAAMVLVSGDPPVGFASVEVVDGVAHLGQLSVLPSASRQGLGSVLVSAVCDWASSQGYEALTLTTFRDVPWNGPFYARMGFRTLDELTPGLAAIRNHEKAIGDDDFGPRIAMRKDLGQGK
jgi:GNAT superfamily N-acetyltransferase